jgi:hypothetical protein
MVFIALVFNSPQNALICPDAMIALFRGIRRPLELCI